MIVRKPGKMRAALNQIFTRRYEDEEAKLMKKIRAFSGKNNGLLFLRVYILKAF